MRFVDWHESEFKLENLENFYIEQFLFLFSNFLIYNFLTFVPCKLKLLGTERNFNEIEKMRFRYFYIVIS